MYMVVRSSGLIYKVINLFMVIVAFWVYRIIITVCYHTSKSHCSPVCFFKEPTILFVVSVIGTPSSCCLRQNAGYIYLLDQRENDILLAPTLVDLVFSITDNKYASLSEVIACEISGLREFCFEALLHILISQARGARVDELKL